MAAITVLNYLPRKSPVHALTGATKLAFFLLFTFASMVTYDTRVLIVLMAFSFAAFRLSRIRLREVRFMLVFMLVFLLLNNFFIYLFDPDQGTKIYGTRHVLLHIAGRYDVTSEQLFYMLNISLKYFVALPVAILFISATNPSEFAASLNKIGVPYRIGYAVSIALRYIPDIQRDYHNISQAQQARGVELGKKERLISRLKNSVSILLPLIMSSLARVDVISNAMELRGFGKNKKRTWYVERPFRRGDWIALGLGAALLAMSLIVTFWDGNRFYNPFVLKSNPRGRGPNGPRPVSLCRPQGRKAAFQRAFPGEVGHDRVQKGLKRTVMHLAFAQQRMQLQIQPGEHLRAVEVDAFPRDFIVGGMVRVGSRRFGQMFQLRV